MKDLIKLEFNAAHGSPSYSPFERQDSIRPRAEADTFKGAIKNCLLRRKISGATPHFETSTPLSYDDASPRSPCISLLFQMTCSVLHGARRAAELQCNAPG